MTSAVSGERLFLLFNNADETTQKRKLAFEGEPYTT